MGRRIYGKVKLAPDAAFLLAVLANFPFAFAIDLESGGIDDREPLGHGSVGGT